VEIVVMADAAPEPGWKKLVDYDISRPEDALALVENFQAEWGNGGFSQLFANWNRADIVLIPEAMRIVGAPEAALVVEVAIAKFPDDKDDWRDLGHQALINPASPLREPLWTLNDTLDEHEPALAEAAIAFELKLSEDEDL
jgi:hypothetical protein